MKTLRVALASMMIAAFAVLAPSPAHAYPGVTVTVSDHVVVGGNEVTITATVDPPVNCDWELTYDGVTKTGTGSSITRTFDTDVVDEVREDTSFATCTFDDSELAAASGGGSAGSLGASFVTAEQSASGEGTVVLLPRGGDDDDGDGDGDGDGGGLLPDTGGERLAWLIIGGILVLAGGGTVIASRRNA